MKKIKINFIGPSKKDDLRAMVQIISIFGALFIIIPLGISFMIWDSSLNMILLRGGVLELILLSFTFTRITLVDVDAVWVDTFPGHRNPPKPPIK